MHGVVRDDKDLWRMAPSSGVKFITSELPLNAGGEVLLFKIYI